MAAVHVGRDNEPVARNIKRIIVERGLKQYVIAQAAGYSAVQMSDMINGRKVIKPRDIVALAGALEVDAGELFATGE